MARRNAGQMQREGSVKDWAEFDPSPSPKMAYSQSYVAMRGLLTSVASLDLVLMSSSLKSAWATISSHKHARSLERPKSKAMSWKKAMFHLSVCFMIGIFIGFTPLFSVDLSNKIPSEKVRLPFDGDVTDRRQLMEHQGTKLEPFIAEAESEADNEPQVEDSPPVPAMLDDEADFVEASSMVHSVNDSDIVVRKQLIIVTATTVRPHQAYYLNRLVHVLKDVPPPLLWIVAEWPYQSRETVEILRSSGIMYRHITCNRNTTNVRKIVVCQKNNAIFHIKKHHLDGIVHFADEERAYSVDLFEEMRKIRRFGTWPVATHVGTKYRVALEGPLCKGGQVTGWLGVLVNNAGVSYPYARYFHEVDEELMRSLIRVNVEGVTRVTHAVLPGMVERKRGAIVNIGSGAASVVPSDPLYSVYAATKAYVDQFSRCLYVEYKGKGIDVQCQVPLYVATKMASIRRSSFLVPSADTYARAAIRHIGYEPRCTPYWPHSVMWFLISLLPESLVDSTRLSMCIKIRKKGQAKDAKKKAQ